MFPARDILKKYWGFDQFRPNQESIINNILDGKDTLALLPTGGGKSICYQVPGLIKEGICLVISPLIALMNDQVSNLKRRGIGAIAISSVMNKREIDINLDNCIYGNIKFLYVSPERLKNKLFLERLKKMTINLVAIDESHCISQWGYDFRPPYLEISALKSILPAVPFLALTATATTNVISDIQEKLNFKKSNVISSSFRRSNLQYFVIPSVDKRKYLLKMTKKLTGSGIVYCGTRKGTMETSEFLNFHGLSADYYHAGLEPEVRNRKQQNWFTGITRIMVCTNAFGMGIDKSDVRFVIHLNMPSSLEAYIQEAGRAGRDGNNAKAILLVALEDQERLHENIENEYPPKEDIKCIYTQMCSLHQIAFGSGEEILYNLDYDLLKQKTGLPLLTLMNALKILERAGYLILSENYKSNSTVKIECNHQILYDHQVRNVNHNPVIQVLLRLYSGIFDNFLAIQEKQIAQILKTKETMVRKILRELNKLELLTYNELPKGAYFMLSQPREQEKNIRISKDVYENRKKDALSKLISMTRYAFSTSLCREAIYLKYFGETQNSPCGQCDVCLENNQRKIKIDLDQLEIELLDILIHHPAEISDIITRLGHKYNEKDVIECTRQLLDRGKLIFNTKNQLVRS